MTIQIYWQQKSHASKVDEKKKKIKLGSRVHKRVYTYIHANIFLLKIPLQIFIILVCTRTCGIR